MRIQYVEKNINVSKDFKEKVEEKLSKLNKFFNSDVESKVSFSSHGNFNTVEVTVWLKKGTILRAEETSDDMLSSVDRVVDALEKQIRKYKTKLQSKHSGDSIRYEEVLSDETTILLDDMPKVAKVKKIGLKPMFIEDAIMQMDLLGHDFFMYQDAETNLVSVVYKRNSGDYGLIEQG